MKNTLYFNTNQSRIEKMILILLFLTITYTEIKATIVTFSLKDQNGNLITSSQFVVVHPFSGLLQEGEAITLSPGEYTIRIFPGINDEPQTVGLYREQPVSVSGDTQHINFEWGMAELILTLTDQNGNPIDGTQFYHAPAIFNAFILNNSESIFLPITDDLNHTLFGNFADGFAIRIWPGFNGSSQVHALGRNEPQKLELPIEGVSETYVWETAALSLTLEDQHGDPVDGTLFYHAPANFSAFILENEEVITLPVTEDTSHNIVGSLADGYAIRIWPGINGVNQITGLGRDEPQKLELSAAGLSETYNWEVANGTLHVVDGFENEACGASYRIDYFSAQPTGTFSKLPITDPAVYPDLFGNWQDGYLVKFQLVDEEPFTETYTLNLLSGSIFDPNVIPVFEHGLRMNLDTDMDGDGHYTFNSCNTPNDDCDDTNAAVHPDAPEICGDGLDNNCDGLTDPGMTYSGNLTFTSQAAINAFPPCYSTIDGSLLIDGSSSNINSLVNLMNIEEVTGNVVIRYNNYLYNLNGLQNLHTIGGDLNIYNNFNLQNIQHLGSLSNLGGFLNLNRHASLSSLSGLESINHLPGYLAITNNFKLKDFDGLNNLASIGGHLNIESNDKLENFSGLEQLQQVDGYLKIESNKSLEEISALQNLSEVNGDLWITGNYKLTSLNGLSSLENVSGNFHLEYSKKLESLGDLSALTTIGGSLQVNDNKKLGSLAGLESVTSIGSDLIIHYNPKLSDCCVIHSLLEGGIPGAVIIQYNKTGCDNEEEVWASCGGNNLIVPPIEFSNSTLPKEGFRLYPNPSNRILNLDLHNFLERRMSVSIYNHLGQRVWQQVEDQLQNPVLSVDLTQLQLPGGLYILSIRTANAQKTKQFVISR